MSHLGALLSKWGGFDLDTQELDVTWKDLDKQIQGIIDKNPELQSMISDLRKEKLKGSWTLVRMQRSDKNWLLIKHRDDDADQEHDILLEETSVISGLTIDDFKSGHLPSGREMGVARPGDANGAIRAAFPSKLLPMLASPATNPFSDERWLFEPKLDGLRTLALLKDGQVWLQYRRGLDVIGHYPALAESLMRQPA